MGGDKWWWWNPLFVYSLVWRSEFGSKWDIHRGYSGNSRWTFFLHRIPVEQKFRNGRWNSSRWRKFWSCRLWPADVTLKYGFSKGSNLRWMKTSLGTVSSSWVCFFFCAGSRFFFKVSFRFVTILIRLCCLDWLTESKGYGSRYREEKFFLKFFFSAFVDVSLQVLRCAWSFFH